MATSATWYDAIGPDNGDHITLKTRFGFVRIERVADHRGQMFATHGSTEGLHLHLETALDAAVQELATRQQEQHL